MYLITPIENLENILSTGLYPADRIAYIGNINTAERSLLLANAKLNLDSLEVLEKW